MAHSNSNLKPRLQINFAKFASKSYFLLLSLLLSFQFVLYGLAIAALRYPVQPGTRIRSDLDSGQIVIPAEAVLVAEFVAEFVPVAYAVAIWPLPAFAPASVCQQRSVFGVPDWHSAVE